MVHAAGEVAVIFVSCRVADDGSDYAAAAVAMEQEAARQPGYRGIDSARGADGLGITVSWWADEAAARAWRDHPGHAAIRDQGRARWYDSYVATVAEVTRSYAWRREEASPRASEADGAPHLARRAVSDSTPPG